MDVPSPFMTVLLLHSRACTGPKPSCHHSPPNNAVLKEWVPPALVTIGLQHNDIRAGVYSELVHGEHSNKNTTAQMTVWGGHFQRSLI